MDLSGWQKTAVVLLCLDEPQALEVIAQLDDEEVKRIYEEADLLEQIDGKTIARVLAEFSTKMQSPSRVRRGPLQLRGLLQKALAQRDPKSKAVLHSGPPSAHASPKNAKDHDPEGLGTALGQEHPQVASAMLAHMDPHQSASALGHLPPERQLELLRRMAGMGPVPKRTLDQAFENLSRALGRSVGKGAGTLPKVDGLAAVVGVLKTMGALAAGELLDRLAAEDPEQAQTLRRALFRFEDLLKADARGLQNLMREVPREVLLKALRTAGPELKEKLLGSMSKRAAAQLTEDLEAMPPIRVSEVVEAQQRVADLALQLIDAGKLLVSGHGGDELV